ncbi:MAG TPA: RyR domain-containing protein [Oscillatoriaceae cyanobacterium]
MDLEKIAEASHQAWFVAMAKQGWIFGPRLNPDFKTHPWLKPYAGLSDGAKEIVRAQVRGTLGALEAQGYLSLKPGTLPPQKPVTVTMPAQAAPKHEAAPTPTPVPAAKAEPTPAPVATPAPKAAPAEEDTQVIERRVDASGRMRIGAGLVKKADLLRGGNTQVAIVQRGDAIEVLPYDPDLADAFFASVNPDGFMLPKAMLAASGAKDFILTLSPGRLVVRPK